MPYIEGFVAAVPTTSKEDYRKHAKQAVAYFKSLGASRLVECWGDDVPKGLLTDFCKATQAKDDETPMFSWIEYPDKATRVAANEKMGEDAEHGEHGAAVRRQADVLGRFRADRQRIGATSAGKSAAESARWQPWIAPC